MTIILIISVLYVIIFSLVIEISTNRKKYKELRKLNEVNKFGIENSKMLFEVVGRKD